MRRTNRWDGVALASLLAGAVIGASLALLLAPEGGQENRHRLARWLHDHRFSGRNGHARTNGHSRALRHKRGFDA